MEWCVVTPLISLSDVLALQDQPVCEEQAWALCYQLCLLLDKNLHPDFSHRPWGGFKVPGPEEIFLSPDGSLSLRMSISKTEEQFLMKTEDQTVDYVGRLMYSCLDWGLGADVERELDETLELMVGQMTKVDTRLGSEAVLQPICTISDVIQVCEERLYNPSQAAQHYRSVCATLYSHTVELCHYLQVIQNTRESLQNMIMESETPQVHSPGTNGKFAWRHLIDELKMGVVLQPPTDNVKTDVPVDTSPFDQLLQDIRLKRYTLRKVEVDGSEEQNKDPHQALLAIIRSRPKLRPVSERVSRQNGKCELSLHEMLMQEIRTMDRTKLRSCRTGPSSRDSLHEESFFLNSLSSTDPVGTPCVDGTSPDGSSSHNGSMTGSIDVQKETSRIPSQILSSTPMRFSREGTASRKKLRARSFGSSQELRPKVLESQISVPLTIAELIKTHYCKEVKTTSASWDSCRNWRVCSCCTKRSLYFTWHNCCSLCSRTVCPDCCFELRLPFKWCVNLPISFFKIITLNENCEQSKKEFWSERWSWDSSRVPLVLTSLVPASCSPHSLVMRDWHSQEVCAGCQELLSEAFSSDRTQNQIKVSREI